MLQIQDKIETKIGICALCGSENVVLRLSHSIPKFAYDWIKDTSSSPFLREINDVNTRHQDGPKQYLLCDVCEGRLSDYEDVLAVNVFKRIANYRKQAQKLQINEDMRIAVLSIFWRALLTTKDNDNNRIDEDNKALDDFLLNAKKQINENRCDYTLYFAPIYGEPPHYGLSIDMTYGLDRSVGGQDMRFFDDPHRYISLFKLPFMYFFIMGGEWDDSELNRATKFESGLIEIESIKLIPRVLVDIIKKNHEEFLKSIELMNEESKLAIVKSMSKKKGITGSDKSLKRTGWD
ncbi:hypothetical protein AB7W87_15245 [Providencia alcalifaciens]|uniref:hypothetical protein n=1 Tax=Providencia huashanensis TaxID=3037798 RepID=UPI002AFFF9E7|nr:hypothetical protein [Providencia sp. 23021821]